MNQTLLDGMNFILLKDASVKKESVASRCVAACNAIENEKVLSDKFEHLDPNISSPGGYVFLWEDVLSLGDIYDSLKELNLPPNMLGTALWKLLTLIRNIRRVRVSLTESEFKFLRAVKCGYKSIESISEYIQVSTDEAFSIAVELEKKMYSNNTPILECKSGIYFTKF